LCLELRRVDAAQTDPCYDRAVRQADAGDEGVAINGAEHVNRIPRIATALPQHFLGPVRPRWRQVEEPAHRQEGADRDTDHEHPGQGRREAMSPRRIEVGMQPHGGGLEVAQKAANLAQNKNKWEGAGLKARKGGKLNREK
jgi:hypothetical protein